MITARIIGEDGKQLKINGEGEVSVVIHQHPPIDEDIFALPFRSYFTDNGLPSGVNTMNVDGSTNYVTALTNGVAFYWDSQKEPLYELHEGIKTNKEFIRIASDTGAIGTGTEAYLADVSGGGTEKSYLPNMDMTEIYGLPWGLRLKRNSLDKIIFRVQDNLTGLSTFNAIATGTRI
jgi:hypothetical protein